MAEFNVDEYIEAIRKYFLDREMRYEARQNWQLANKKGNGLFGFIYIFQCQALPEIQVKVYSRSNRAKTITRIEEEPAEQIQIQEDTKTTVSINEPVVKRQFRAGFRTAQLHRMIEKAMPIWILSKCSLDNPRNLTDQIKKDLFFEFSSDKSSATESYSPSYKDEMEELFIGLQILPNNMAIYGVNACDKNHELCVYYFIYFDGIQLRAYVPRAGNSWYTGEDFNLKSMMKEILSIFEPV